MSQHEINQSTHKSLSQFISSLTSLPVINRLPFLRSSGAPLFLIQLIEHLHTGTTSRVRVGGQLSEPFETTSGVRQGCVLAPALFCIAIDWILSSCTGIMGTIVGSSRFTDQDYADDCPSKWPYILSTFDEAAQTMGLNTSWSKTKIQNLGHGITTAPVQLQGPRSRT